MTVVRAAGDDLVTIGRPVTGTPTTDAKTSPAPRNRTLEAAGWQRRFLADEHRAREAVELYSSLGLEVRAETLRPADFGPACDACSDAVCTNHVLIYTRERLR